jgi:hypothetical protein
VTSWSGPAPAVTRWAHDDTETHVHAPHTVERPSTSPLRLAVLATGLLALVVALLPSASPAEAFPVESSCNTRTGGTGIAGFIDHDQLGSRLTQLERSSRHIEVDQVGETNQGREIWSARVGDGDDVVLIQTEIHGNEKHGTVAALDLLRTLGNNSPRSAEIRDAVTVVVIPMMNADGSELDQRVNDMTWADAVAAFPQLEEASAPAWNWRSNVPGYDVNRDFNPDLDYTPDPADFPGNSASVGWYITPEAQTVRDVYRDLEDEFGLVDVFVDLHGQGPCYVGDTMPDDYSPLSISGRFIADPDSHGDWPEFDFDASRRANVAVHDALQVGDSPFGKVTLYPQSIDLPGTALGSFALRGSATVLFETSGQTQHIGHKRGGMLVRQIETGLMGIVDALTDGTFDDIDPERYDDIPEQVRVRTDD